MIKGNYMKLESIALHHGYKPEDNQKAAATPIYQSSGFTIDDTQHGADLFDLKVEGNIYSRIGNPTNAVLEDRVAAMEGGVAGLALASGIAAITYAIQCITVQVIILLAPTSCMGEHIIALPIAFQNKE